MKKLAVLVLLVLAGAEGTPSATLYDQSIAQVLGKQFSSPALSYLVINVQTGTRVAARWENLGQPVPAGSMVKPFTALAYGEAHGYRYPAFACRGTADGCWLPRGHGRIGMSEAIGYSCNAYFRKLAAEVSRQDVEQISFRFGFQDRFALPFPLSLVGLRGGPQIPPE